MSKIRLLPSLLALLLMMGTCFGQSTKKPVKDRALEPTGTGMPLSDAARLPAPTLHRLPHFTKPEIVPALPIGARNCMEIKSGMVNLDGPCAGYTCKDKKRVLLTTEEGEKICVRF